MVAFFYFISKTSHIFTKHSFDKKTTRNFTSHFTMAFQALSTQNIKLPLQRVNAQNWILFCAYQQFNYIWTLYIFEVNSQRKWLKCVHQLCVKELLVQINALDGITTFKLAFIAFTQNIWFCFSTFHLVNNINTCNYQQHKYSKRLTFIVNANIVGCYNVGILAIIYVKLHTKLIPGMFLIEMLTQSMLFLETLLSIKL